MLAASVNERVVLTTVKVCGIGDNVGVLTSIPNMGMTSRHLYPPALLMVAWMSMSENCRGGGKIGGERRKGEGSDEVRAIEDGGPAHFNAHSSSSTNSCIKLVCTAS